MSALIPHDRDFKLLFDKYKVEVEKLRLLVPAEHSDLWILKFVISAKGDVSQAEHNIKETLAWRESKRIWMEVRQYYQFMIRSSGGSFFALMGSGMTDRWHSSVTALLKPTSYQAAKNGTHDYPHAAVFDKYVASALHRSTTDGDILFLVRAGM